MRSAISAAFVRTAVVFRPDHLVVRHHHLHAELAADAEGFFQRVGDPVALVAHVRAVEPLARAERTADFDHFLGGRGARRLVVQAGRNADRAGRQRFIDELFIAPISAGAAGRSRLAMVATRRVVCPTSRRRWWRPARFQRLHVFRKGAEFVPARIADEVQRRGATRLPSTSGASDTPQLPPPRW